MYYTLIMTTKYHLPQKLSGGKLDLNYNKFAIELADAEYAMGLLQGSQKKLQNASLLISPLTAKEATVSSKIEGTQSTVSDVFLHEAGGETKHPDIAEVANYRAAMNFSIHELQNGRKLSNHLIKTLHNILLKNTRHKGFLGEFRKGDVWIAEKHGDPIDKAIYVPPQPHFVNDYVDDLLKYLNEGNESTLIKAGLAHYQFEAIHPFDDGNGRIGRLLIPLILYHGNRLSKPIFYISGYMERNRDGYIDSLHEVDKTLHFETWLKFFFKSVAEQLKETQKIVEDIYDLYDDIKNNFETNKSPYLIHFLDFIFRSPILTVPMVRRMTKIKSDLTVKRLIKSFIQLGYIKGTSRRQDRAKLYSFTPLLNILK